MDSRTITILGTEYFMEFVSYDEDKRIKEDSLYGYCNMTDKRIAICDLNTQPDWKTESKEMIEQKMKHVMRHEIMHAFLNESGLGEQVHPAFGGWSNDEEIIDWFAIQSPKIFKLFEELNILY